MSNVIDVMAAIERDEQVHTKSILMPLSREAQITFDEMVTGHFLWGRPEASGLLDVMEADIIGVAAWWSIKGSLADQLGRGIEADTLQCIWSWPPTGRGNISLWREKVLATKGLLDLMDERVELWRAE